jgi:hypothetical protein
LSLSLVCLSARYARAYLTVCTILVMSSSHGVYLAGKEPLACLRLSVCLHIYNLPLPCPRRGDEGGRVFLSVMPPLGYADQMPPLRRGIYILYRVPVPVEPLKIEKKNQKKLKEKR